MTAKTIMIQGTASNVGKSLIAAALCRLLKNQGYRVAPFKAQNMSNNACAVKGGGEIGRAQAVQAEACGIEPSVLMNPVLLKPTADSKSQVVLLGKPDGVYSGYDYYKRKKKLLPIINNALQTLMNSCDIVVIEGAGSAAEINLRKHDITNMYIAEQVASPVILVGDIDRGGIFAQINGTYNLLSPSEKKLVSAFIINKFRGEKKLLTSGLKWIEKETKKRILGVVPYIHNHSISQEDAVVLEEGRFLESCDENELLIHVIQFPRISNFTDFEPLMREKGIVLEYIFKPDRHSLPDLLILPGTKNTAADLEFLKKSGFDKYIQRCVKAGVSVLGICGGYQMMGKKIIDTDRVESSKRVCEGLGLIPVITRFGRKKIAEQVRAIHLQSNLKIEGYEIRMGVPQRMNGSRPLFKIIERNGVPAKDLDGLFMKHPEGGQSSLICGTSIHGLFENKEFRRYFLNEIRKNAGLKKEPEHRFGTITPSLDKYDNLAKILEQNIDMKLLGKILK